MLPTHHTVLTISINRVKDFQVDERQSVIGHGTVFENPNRADVTRWLREPLFWAMQLSLDLTTDDVDKPSNHYFGITTDEVNRFYQNEIEERFHSGVNPYLIIPVRGDYYFEYEFSADVEYQDRFWACKSEPATRRLLGYNSGHFSLPALRVEEILWLYGSVIEHPDASARCLLLFSGCYLNGITPELMELVSHWFQELPGTKDGTAQAMAEGFLESRTVANVQWEYRQGLGWINNWRYSQRNPSSPMSILKSDDFLFIRQLFEELEPK